jgi:hypothetical protein
MDDSYPTTDLLRRTEGLSTSMIERSWLDAIDATLVWRRHALTHLSYEPSDGSKRWSFKSCVGPMLSLDELLMMSAGLSRVVMDSVADGLRTEPLRYVCAVLGVAMRGGCVPATLSPAARSAALCSRRLSTVLKAHTLLVHRFHRDDRR